MNEYQLAAYFWSSVAGLAIVGPFVGDLVRRGVDGVEQQWRDHIGHADQASHPLASFPSSPLPSSPG